MWNLPRGDEGLSGFRRMENIIQRRLEGDLVHRSWSWEEEISPEEVGRKERGARDSSKGLG